MEDDPKQRSLRCGYSGTFRDVTLAIGDRCRVEPLNPQAKKDRGRFCTIVGFRKFGASKEMAAVTWEDTKDYGGADMANLVVVPPDGC